MAALEQEQRRDLVRDLRIAVQTATSRDDRLRVVTQLRDLAMTDDNDGAARDLLLRLVGDSDAEVAAAASTAHRDAQARITATK
jgi:hypothetical protein